MCTTILCPIYLAFKLGIQLGDILGKYLYSHIISLSFRPSDSYLERCRKAKIREKMTGIVFKDILTYLLFLLIVAKLAYSEKDMNTYYLRQDIVNMFQLSTYQKGPSFDAVRYYVISLFIHLGTFCFTNRKIAEKAVCRSVFYF